MANCNRQQKLHLFKTVTEACFQGKPTRNIIEEVQFFYLSFFFIILPTKFHAGIFFSVLLTG